MIDGRGPEQGRTQADKEHRGRTVPVFARYSHQQRVYYDHEDGLLPGRVLLASNGRVCFTLDDYKGVYEDFENLVLTEDEKLNREAQASKLMEQS